MDTVTVKIKDFGKVTEVEGFILGRSGPMPRVAIDVLVKAPTGTETYASWATICKLADFDPEREYRLPSVAPARNRNWPVVGFGEEAARSQTNDY